MRNPDLRQISLFRSLTDDEVQLIRGHLRLQVFNRDDLILQEEDAGEVAYVIWQGYVRVEVNQPDGTRTLLTILGPGEIVGELSLVDRLGRSATVVAQDATTLLVFDRATFWAFLRTMPAMTYNLVGLLARRLRLANSQVQALAAMDVEARVARQLQVLAAEHGDGVGNGAVELPFRLTQAELADLVGASRVRVNQVLTTLRREGVISTDSAQRITIHDPRDLEMLWQ
jgi:CRP-like cAMP-binding protein